MTSIFQHSDRTAKLGHVTAVTEDPSKNEEPGSLNKVTIGAVPSGPASLIETLFASAKIGTRVQKRRLRKTLYIFPPFTHRVSPVRLLQGLKQDLLICKQFSFLTPRIENTQLAHLRLNECCKYSVGIE